MSTIGKVLLGLWHIMCIALADHNGSSAQEEDKAVGFELVDVMSAVLEKWWALHQASYARWIEEGTYATRSEVFALWVHRFTSPPPASVSYLEDKISER